MLKRLIVVITGLIAQIMVFAATPQVKNVKAFQQYPWVNKVYISYEVVGDVAASAIGGAVLVVKAKDKTTGRLIYAVYLSGDTGTEVGPHRVVWDIGAQGATINSDNVVFTVMYYDEVYLVVDLSSGANASSYPVFILESAPSGGWSDVYKTTKLVLRRIPAGTFKMQNASNVTLTRPFDMGVFEVTQTQYLLVTGGGNPSHFKGDECPVERVSYDMIRGSSNGAKWPASSAVDSSSFIGKLRARTGLNFDLPTEAQWEYACRAGTTTTYYWGNSMNGSYARYSSNSLVLGSSGNFYNTTDSVGTKAANAWGLYDMSGNVSEWCLDWYGTLAYGTDPKGPSSGSGRVIRGGDYNRGAYGCTSNYRDEDSSFFASRQTGFRLAIQPVE